MKTSFRKSLLSASMALPLVLAAQTGSAAMITEWGYSVDNIFTGVEGSTGNGSITGEGTNTLVWGSGPNSSVTITGNITNPSGLVTNGAAVAGGTFDHNNQPIPASDSALTRFNLQSALTLTAFTPEEYAGTEVGPQNIVFNSFFTETLNEADDCLVSSTSVCDDIFSLTNADIGSFNEEGIFEVNGGSFTIDDYFYEVFLEVEGLIALTDDECALIETAPGCLGFRTLESQGNEFRSRFRIEATAVEVPEPGALALLGLGLVGLGLTRRRMKA